jgi:distribution and morphology protein 34
MVISSYSRPVFNSDFLFKAREQLSRALSHTKQEQNIVDDITVTTLTMGNKPPELQILEIAELTEERFKGILKLVYTGKSY